MTTTIIVIIILVIVVKFFIDRDKMIQKQVDVHGGMRQKYKRLIEGLSQGDIPEFCEVTRDHLYFRLVFGSQTASNYYITEKFNEVSIEWMLQMDSLGNRKLKWTFQENESQEKMLSEIVIDVDKEVLNISINKNNLVKMEETVKKSDEMSDGMLLLVIANVGVEHIEKIHRPLSDKGKLEVIIYNGIIVLRKFRVKYPDRYSAAESEFFSCLLGLFREYEIADIQGDKLIDFINSRIFFYSNQIENIYYVSEELSILPSEVYSAFYETPLSQSIKRSDDILEVMKFFASLSSMMKVVDTYSNLLGEM